MMLIAGFLRSILEKIFRNNKKILMIFGAKIQKPEMMICQDLVYLALFQWSTSTCSHSLYQSLNEATPDAI